MILVREVSQIHPEKMREAKAVMQSMKPLEDRLGSPPSRSMVDLAGEYYTLVIETEYPSFAEFEAAMPRVFADPEWQALYSRMRPMIRGGRRELYTLLD